MVSALQLPSGKTSWATWPKLVIESLFMSESLSTFPYDLTLIYLHLLFGNVYWTKERVTFFLSIHRLVILKSLYGRGYSDSPSVPHDVALYTAQISFLLTANPDWGKFDICGMSLGGPIGEILISLQNSQESLHRFLTFLSLSSSRKYVTSPIISHKGFEKSFWFVQQVVSPITQFQSRLKSSRLYHSVWCKVWSVFHQ